MPGCPHFSCEKADYSSHEKQKSGADRGAVFFWQNAPYPRQMPPFLALPDWSRTHLSHRAGSDRTLPVEGRSCNTPQGVLPQRLLRLRRRRRAGFGLRFPEAFGAPQELGLYFPGVFATVLKSSDFEGEGVFSSLCSSKLASTAPMRASSWTSSHFIWAKFIPIGLIHTHWHFNGRKPRVEPFNMNRLNESVPQGFVLLAFSDRPWLELPLFVVFLVSYILTILGNPAIILVLRLDFKLHTPMYFFLTNLSLLDLCYTTSAVPQMLVNRCSIRKENNNNIKLKETSEITFSSGTDQEEETIHSDQSTKQYLSPALTCAQVTLEVTNKSGG
eukprot:bmy_11218T0